MITESPFIEVLNEFCVCSVDFIIVGGFAVNFHGYERNTSDLDIWVMPNENNKTKICAALRNLKYETRSIAEIERFNFSEPFIFSVGQKPNAIEIFNHITGVTYEEADKNKILFSSTETIRVYFISLRELIVNKMLTGRPKDKLDVDELHRINLHSTNKNILDTIKKLFKK
jgi:hypothetical protein